MSAEGQLEQIAQVTPAKVCPVEIKDWDTLMRLKGMASTDDTGSTLSLEGDCTRPVHLLWHSGRIDLPSGNRIGGALHGSVRCRHCPSCLRARGRQWTARAMVECGKTARTWFCTFTFDWRRKVPAGVEPIAWAQKQVTLAFKRLRKGAGALAGQKFRYLAVFERHQSGLPHVHALIHCRSDLQYRHIQRAWTQNGFMSAKIVRNNRAAAAYVCKYLFKERSIVPRQRASIGYGSEHGFNFDRCSNPQPQAEGINNDGKTIATSTPPLTTYRQDHLAKWVRIWSAPSSMDSKRE